SDFELSVRVHPQHEEMEEVVKINLPICLSVRREREVFAGLFTRDAPLETLLIDLSANPQEVLLSLRELLPGGEFEEARAPLAIAGGLLAPFVGLRGLGGVDRLGISRGVFVDVRRSVAD